MNKRIIIGVVITLLLFTAGSALAAVPLLQDFLGVIPKPVTNFFHMLQNFNFGSNPDAIVPGASNSATSTPHALLDFLWSMVLVLVNGVGSIFVWIFHAIADGLEGLIFSK